MIVNCVEGIYRWVLMGVWLPQGGFLKKERGKREKKSNGKKKSSFRIMGLPIVTAILFDSSVGPKAFIYGVAVCVFGCLCFGCVVNC